MSLEVLNAILTKEEVIFTRKSHDLLERPAEVDAYYKIHIRTYVPMHSGISGEDQLDVETFAKRLIQQIKAQRAPRGYITADFGYGKTSAGIYIWYQAAESNLVAVPPFQLNSLLDFVVATYGWVNYILGISRPSLQQKAEHIYRDYGERSLASLAARYGGNLSMIQQMHEDGIINLDLRPSDIVQFFDDMTALVIEAGYEGLLLLPDEVQQYLEPQIKAGKTDPIAPLFNIIQEVGARQGRFPFGLLLIIPQKDLGAINDQRGDLIDRLRGMTLDLKTIYDEGFPVRLWDKLAEIFEFKDYAYRMVSRDTLDSIGQIAARADLANGPRTVINTFRRITARYIELHAPAYSPYSAIDLIDDFLGDKIAFDGMKRIQEEVNRALRNDIVYGKPELTRAIKLAAAFPTGGVKADLQAQYQLREAFAELLNSAFGTLVSNIGDRNNPGTILLGLQQIAERREWLEIVLAEFNRTFYENAALTKSRASRAFGMLLVQKIFKGENWMPRAGMPEEGSETRGHSLIFEGAFPSFARDFPKRILQVRIIVDDGQFRSNDPSADVLVDFHLRRYLDLDESSRQQVVVPAQLIQDDHRALLTINLMKHAEALGNRALETTLTRVIPAERLTPLFLLTLYAHLQNQIDNAPVPKLEKEMLTSQFLPAVLDSVLGQVMDSTISGEFDAAGVRLVEVLIKDIVAQRYGKDYYTLMAMKTGWQIPLRGYISALRQFDTAAEKQGDLDVEGTKEEIAKRLSMSNTSLDTFMNNFPQLLDVVRDFRSKPKGQSVASGAVRFRLHPLETKIADWLEKSPTTKTIREQIVHLITVDDIKRRAYRLGYKEPEVDQLLEIMEAREMILRDKHGAIEQKLRTIVPYQEAEARVAQLQIRIGDIQRAFPNARGLSLFIENTSSLAAMLPASKKKGQEKLIEKIAITARNIYRSVEEIGEGCVQDLIHQIGTLINRIPILDTTIAVALSEAVSGSPQFVVALDEIRQALLREFDAVAEVIAASEMELKEIKMQLEANNYAYETLSELTAVIRETDTRIEKQREQINGLADRRRYFTSWRRVAGEWFDLEAQLHQLGETGTLLVSQLEELETEIAAGMLSQALEALPYIDHYEKRFNDLRNSMRRVEGEAKAKFGTLQDGYLRLLRGVGCISLWMPIIYSSHDPDGIYAQLYQQAHEATVTRLDALDEQLQQQYNKLRQKLITADKEQAAPIIDGLLARIEVYKGQLPYEEAKNLENVKDFDGVFTSLAGEIENVWDGLKAVQIEIENLEKVGIAPELSPDEQKLWEILSSSQEIDLSELVSTPEEFDRLWPTIRLLWEKGKLRISLGLA